jgi:lipopolysaccharide export system permease protein
MPLPDVNTPPKQLSLIISQPEELTVSQLSQYIATSSQTPERLADYRTEWWYRVLYPFSILVLILFPLVQGARTDRRSAMAGVGVAILVLVIFIIASGCFMGLGRHDRLPPFVAAAATEVILGAVGLYLLAISNGWWWQLREVWKNWYGSDDEDEAPPIEPGKTLHS